MKPAFIFYISFLQMLKQFCTDDVYCNISYFLSDKVRRYSTSSRIETHIYVETLVKYCILVVAYQTSFDICPSDKETCFNGCFQAMFPGVHSCQRVVPNPSWQYKPLNMVLILKDSKKGKGSLCKPANKWKSTILWFERLMQSEKKTNTHIFSSSCLGQPQSFFYTQLLFTKLFYQEMTYIN